MRSQTFLFQMLLKHYRTTIISTLLRAVQVVAKHPSVTGRVLKTVRASADNAQQK